MDKGILLIIFTITLLGIMSQTEGRGKRECPPNNGYVGTCSVTSNNCENHNQCRNGKMCCSNGCGKVCTSAVRKFSGETSPQGRCPPSSGLLGICTITDKNCFSHKECGNGKLCCPAGCGSECKAAIQ